MASNIDDASDRPPSMQGLPKSWLSLLITDHLDGQGRLMLFQTCKAMSKAVLQHEGAQLTLSTTHKQQTTAQQAQAQAIAADASQLSIKLQGQLFPLESCIWESVTSLELRKVTLPADWSCGLYNLPHLDILSLKTCRFPEPPGPTLPGGPYRGLPALRKVILSDNTPQGHILAHFMPLLKESRTLTHLVSDDRSAILLLPALYALTALQCTYSEYLHGGELNTMSQHRTLAHVVLNRVFVLGSHPLAVGPAVVNSWKTLQLLGGAMDHVLAALPLAGLDCFTLAGCIQLCDKGRLQEAADAKMTCRGAQMCLRNPNAPIDNLLRCKQVVFKGSKKNGWQAPYKPTEPCFHVYELHEKLTGEHCPIHPQLYNTIQVAAKHTQGVLALHACFLSPGHLPLVAALNPAIHTFCIITSHAPATFWTALLRNLPPTIRHVCVASSAMDAAHMAHMLSGSKPPTSLKLITLSESGDDKPWNYPMGTASRKRVSAEAAKHLPDVTFRWQNEYYHRSE